MSIQADASTSTIMSIDRIQINPHVVANMIEKFTVANPEHLPADALGALNMVATKLHNARSRKDAHTLMKSIPDANPDMRRKLNEKLLNPKLIKDKTAPLAKSIAAMQDQAFFANDWTTGNWLNIVRRNGGAAAEKEYNDYNSLAMAFLLVMGDQPMVQQVTNGAATNQTGALRFNNGG